MKLIIVDGNNWFRRKAESSLTGRPVRDCLYELQNLTHNNVVICTWDGKYALTARKKLYPEYKAKRNKPGEGFFEVQKLFKDVLSFSSVMQVTVDGYEADDVIAELVTKYRYSMDVFIESNDADLGQLGVMTSRPTPYPDKAHFIALYKTFVGDPSDNIPGCKGFGKTSWSKLNDDQKWLLSQTFLSGHGLSKEEVIERLSPLMPKGSLNWYLENRDTLLMYHKIVNFIPIPLELIDKNLVQGFNRLDLAEDILREIEQ